VGSNPATPTNVSRGASGLAAHLTAVGDSNAGHAPSPSSSTGWALSGVSAALAVQRDVRTGETDGVRQWHRPVRSAGLGRSSAARHRRVVAVRLSLRPLAAELGTSDRMLIYHFGSKERLISEVLALAQRRLAVSLEPPGPEVSSLSDVVHHLWAALRTPTAAGVTRLYLEICVLSVQEPERWSAAPEQLRRPWRAPLQSGLVAFGIAPERATTLADLILDTLDGLRSPRPPTSVPGSVGQVRLRLSRISELPR
jgi:AcrR family transcriptional regulator